MYIKFAVCLKSTFKHGNQLNIPVHLNTLEETERKLKETEDDRDRIIKEKDEEIAELNHNMTALEHSYKRILDVSIGTFFIALDSKSEHWRTKCMKISRYKYSISQNLFFHCGQGLFSVNLLSEFDKSEFIYLFFFGGGGFWTPPDPLFPSRFGHTHIY